MTLTREAYTGEPECTILLSISYRPTVQAVYTFLVIKKKLFCFRSFFYESVFEVFLIVQSVYLLRDQALKGHRSTYTRSLGTCMYTPCPWIQKFEAASRRHRSIELAPAASQIGNGGTRGAAGY